MKKVIVEFFSDPAIETHHYHRVQTKNETANKKETLKITRCAATNERNTGANKKCMQIKMPPQNRITPVFLYL